MVIALDSKAKSLGSWYVSVYIIEVIHRGRDMQKKKNNLERYCIMDQQI